MPSSSVPISPVIFDILNPPEPHLVTLNMERDRERERKCLRNARANILLYGVIIQKTFFYSTCLCTLTLCWPLLSVCLQNVLNIFDPLSAPDKIFPEIADDPKFPVLCLCPLHLVDLSPLRWRLVDIPLPFHVVAVELNYHSREIKGNSFFLGCPNTFDWMSIETPA
jgi:hypothetical protein